MEKGKSPAWFLLAGSAVALGLYGAAESPPPRLQCIAGWQLGAL